MHARTHTCVLCTSGTHTHQCIASSGALRHCTHAHTHTYYALLAHIRTNALCLVEHCVIARTHTHTYVPCTSGTHTHQCFASSGALRQCTHTHTQTHTHSHTQSCGKFQKGLRTCTRARTHNTPLHRTIDPKSVFSTPLYRASPILFPVYYIHHVPLIIMFGKRKGLPFKTLVCTVRNTCYAVK